MASGRGRLSFWDTLPDWAEPVRIWASEQLNENKLTQLEILDEVNKQLRAAAWAEGVTADVPQASRSSLNRMAMKLAAIGRRMREAREMYAGLAAQFDAADVDESSIVLGEFLKTLITELNAEGVAATPKAAMELASAYRSIISGQKISADRRRKLETELAAKTDQAIERVAKEAGLTEERAAQIRREVLGLRTPAPPAS